MKITIIGAGSTYTPELIEGLILHREDLPLDALSLMDIDHRKLSIVGDLSNRMLEAANMPVRAELTEDLDRALTGADYVLVQIRVGKLPARILDETIPLKYNLIGQETTGIGGFFKALRTIPVLKDIAGRMEVLCPNAWMFNFTNPSGIMAEMVLNHTNVRMVGLCNCPINMIGSVREAMNLPDAEMEFAGLNHLSWITSIKSRGREYIEDAIAQGVTAGMMKNVSQAGQDYDVVRKVHAIPTAYQQYYYFRNAKQDDMKKAEKSRGEVCVEIEEKLLEQYQNPNLSIKPPELSLRGGARYSEAAINLLSAIHNDKKERHVVNILSRGAVPFLEDHDAVEIASIAGRGGVTPIPLQTPVNPHIRALCRIVKEYEKLTVLSGLTGDDEAALNALLVHPLVGDYTAAKACYLEMKQAHKAYLPQFFK